MAPRTSANRAAASPSPVASTPPIPEVPADAGVVIDSVIASATSSPPPPTSVVSDVYVQFMTKINIISAELRELSQTAKLLMKEYSKMQKNQKKSVGRKGSEGKAAAGSGDDSASPVATKREPSGFAKPTVLSPEMCAFLNLPLGTKLARTEVTRLLNRYVKEHNLQSSEDRRTIIPDEPLRKILSINSDAKVTYFNLQSHIKHHFEKAPAAVVATTS